MEDLWKLGCFLGVVVGGCGSGGVEYVISGQARVNVCGKVVIIAETVTSINGYAFSGCFSLKTIEIPESVTYIADTAFTKTGVTL